MLILIGLILIGLGAVGCIISMCFILLNVFKIDDNKPMLRFNDIFVNHIKGMIATSICLGVSLVGAICSFIGVMT